MKWVHYRRMLKTRAPKPMQPRTLKTEACGDDVDACAGSARGCVLYTKRMGVSTLQYVSAAHWRQVLVTRPWRSDESCCLNPSMHEHSEARETPGGVKLLAGQLLATPVQHHFPAGQRVQTAFLTPRYPALQ